MRTFVDTSAIFAYYDADDKNHALIKALWQGLVAAESELVTTNYVLLEAYSLLQRRLGVAWAERLEVEARPFLGIVWVGQDLHDAAVAVTLTARRRDLSLVDCVSFEIMRRYGITHALSFDRHFAERGYPLPDLQPE